MNPWLNETMYLAHCEVVAKAQSFVDGVCDLYEVRKALDALADLRKQIVRGEPVSAEASPGEAIPEAEEQVTRLAKSLAKTIPFTAPEQMEHKIYTYLAMAWMRGVESVERCRANAKPPTDNSMVYVVLYSDRGEVEVDVHSVFATREQAEAYCEAQSEAQKKTGSSYHWSVHERKVDAMLIGKTLAQLESTRAAASTVPTTSPRPWKGRAADGSVGFDCEHEGRRVLVTLAADGNTEILICPPSEVRPYACVGGLTGCTNMSVSHGPCATCVAVLREAGIQALRRVLEKATAFLARPLDANDPLWRELADAVEVARMAEGETRR